MRRAFELDGRFSARDYGVLLLLYLLTGGPLTAVAMLAMRDDHQGAGLALALAGLVFHLFASVALFMAGIQRLHDAGKSGWWLLVSLVPCGGIVLLGYLLLAPSDPNTEFAAM
jgi:uncharacterized membrane protein YhaH (DUF805 family)